MDAYHIFVDLRDSRKDLDFARDVHAWLGHLRDRGLLESFDLERRKLGLGADGFPEFHIVIRTRDLAQLDAAFQEAARRTGESEALHARVYSAVEGFKAALYRTFPDSVRGS